MDSLPNLYKNINLMKTDVIIENYNYKILELELIILKCLSNF